MNGLLDYQQTSGNHWRVPNLGRVYDRSQERVAASAQQLESEAFAQLEAQMVRFESDHETLVARIRRHYVVPNDQSVESFFRAHRTLPSLLLEAVQHLYQHFGNTVFSLRVSADEYGWQSLYAVAIWPEAAQDVLTAIDQFEDTWWIKNSSPAAGSLIFTYQLV